MAAGGELTIKFGGVSSTAHGMFTPATADNVLINTCRFGQDFASPHVEGLAGTTSKYEISSIDEAAINSIDIFVRTQQAAYELSAYQGEAPHKLCVPVGTRWAFERTPIEEAYTGFETYVGGGAEPWATTGVEENLYPLDGVAYEMKTNMVGQTSYSEISSSSETTYSYTLADAANEHLWWSDVSGNTKFVEWGGHVPVSADELNAAEIGNGTIIRFYFTCENNYMIKATDFTWGDFDLGNAGWNQNYIQGSSKSGYVEFKLNTTTANRFKQSGLIIQGTGGVTALALTYDNSHKVADGGSSTEIWTGNQTFSNWDWNNRLEFNASVFSNVTENSKIIVYGSGSNGWQVKFRYLGFEGWKIPGWNSDVVQKGMDGIYSDHFEFTLGSTIASNIKNNGMIVFGSNYTVTKIVLVE